MIQIAMFLIIISVSIICVQFIKSAITYETTREAVIGVIAFLVFVVGELLGLITVL